MKKLLINIAFFTVIGFVLFMLITSKTALVGGVRSFVVITGSMVPAIPIGSIVFTQPQTEYNVGDVIAFTRGSNTITHRITVKKVSGSQASYETKGDANNGPDLELVTQNNVIGKLVFSLPYVGRIIMFIRTIPGFLALVVLPTLIFIALESKKVKREIEKEFEKKIMKKLEDQKSKDEE